MAKLGFTIKVVSKPKAIKENRFIRVGKKCRAVVINYNGTLKARLISSPVEGCDELSEFRVIDFTDNSFDIIDKTHIFLNNKDKYNHYVCIIKSDYNNIRGFDYNKCHTLHENLVIEGNVMRKGNIYYFDYKILIAFKEGGGLITQ